MSRYPMTKEGESFLREELKDLKSGPRTNVVKAIAEARKLGDLKENAEYHAALEQQRFIESRIREIESKLADSQIIDIPQIQPTGPRRVVRMNIPRIHCRSKRRFWQAFSRWTRIY